MNGMNLVDTKYLSRRFGWSRRTVERRAKAGLFPRYKLSRREVKYDLDEVMYYVQGSREGNFDQKGAA